MNASRAPDSCLVPRKTTLIVVLWWRTREAWVVTGVLENGVQLHALFLHMQFLSDRQIPFDPQGTGCWVCSRGEKVLPVSISGVVNRIRWQWLKLNEPKLVIAQQPPQSYPGSRQLDDSAASVGNKAPSWNVMLLSFETIPNSCWAPAADVCANFLSTVPCSSNCLSPVESIPQQPRLESMVPRY